MPKLDETRPFLAVQIGVMTVSDTRTVADDKSGQTLVDLITRDGHTVVDRIIVHDDADRDRRPARSLDLDATTSTW